MSVSLADIEKLESEPVSPDAPGGTDPRHSEPHDALLAEMGKLTSIQGAESFSWQTAADKAYEVLHTIGRDFQTSAYLAIALCHTDGVPGCTAGTKVLSGMFTNFWDTGFPPIKRLRGRMNALSWWHERVLEFLGTVTEETDAAVVEDLKNSVSSLDSSVGDRNPDAAPMRDILDAIRHIPLKAAPAPAPEPAPAAAETPPPAAAPAEQPQAPAPAPAQPAPQQPAATAVSAPAAVPAPPSTGNALADAQAYLLAAGRAYYDAAFAGPDLPQDANAWLALGLVLWGRIAALPPNAGGRTQIPPVDPDRLNAILNLSSSGKPAVAARAAALLAPESPFTFTLARLIDEGLADKGNGFAAARKTFASAVQALTSRFPDIVTMTFSDGSSFADGTTKAWIEGLAAGGSGPVQKDPVKEISGQAMAAASQGDAAAGLGILDKALAATAYTAGRDRLRLRLTALRLLTSNGERKAAILQADLLEEAVETYALSEWEPALAAECLEAVLAARRGALVEAEADATDQQAIRAYREAVLKTSHALARIRLSAGVSTH